MQILQTIWTALTTENEFVLNLTGIPFSFIEVYVSMLIFTTLFKTEVTKNSKILYVIVFSIIGSLSRFFIPDPYGLFLNFIICPLLIMKFFKVSFLKSLVCEFLPIIIESIFSFIVIKTIVVVFHLPGDSAMYIPIYRSLSSIIEYLFMFLFYLLIKNISIPKNFLDSMSLKLKIILILNLILGIFSIATQMCITIYYTQLLPFPMIFLSISSLIAYFIISIYSLISTNKLNIAKQNLEETRLMNKTLTILNDKIRAFRHDFNNIIQALGGYIQAKDIDGLKKYYSQLLKDCQEVNNLTGLNPESINNPAIYSLLASKYYLATEKGIEFDLDIFMDLTSIDMKIYEFCRILGILLDNAIQATQECEEKHIRVTIRKDNRCKRQLLIVENTYKEKDIDTEKIFEKGYSTKEGNTGLGLWEVRQILLKNTNLNLFTSKDNIYFKQQLEIYKS